MYSEDADLAIRARARGYRPTICPEAVIVHDVGKASATRLDKLMLSFTGRATLIRTHWKGLRRTLGLNLLLLGVAVRALLAKAFKNQARAGAWPGLWAGRARWVAGFSGVSKNARG
jgi:GT2 family glycosyltransferase